MKSIKLLLSLIILLLSCTQGSNSKRIKIDSLLYNVNDSARLHIVDTAALNRVDTNYMRTGFYLLSYDNNGVRKREEKTGEIYSIASTPFASVDDVIKTSIQKTKLENGEEYSELCLTFNEKGTENIKAATNKALQSKMAVIIANKLIYVVKIEGVIKTGVVYIGLYDYTEEEIEALKKAVDNKE